MGIEYERKYKASPATLDRLQQTMEKTGTVIAMETTYYDTPEYAFSARHWTVRRRLENGKSVCTFKFPVNAIGRGEFQVESASLEEAIAELCKLSCKEELAALANGGLIPVCGARFTRTAFDLEFGGSRIELALDRGVLLGGGKELPLWEVEAELKAGSTADVDKFGIYLETAFGLVPEALSKFARAKKLAKGEM